MITVKIRPKIFELQLRLVKYFSTLINAEVNNLTTFDFGQELTTETKLQIEKKWKKFINNGTFNEKSQKKKFYVLSMFPYPSGNLHMGHVRVYTISDAISRFHRLQGKNVFQPIGFDAFGLPAENAARERNILPEKWTETNITSMREQLHQLGFSFDWDYEIITCSPLYYKFTQYLFLLMYKEGLVYRKEAMVNWDPVDQTVLADEQVDSQGKSWRSGAFVEKRFLNQWFIRTTHFAQSLYSGLNDPGLKDWKDVIFLQRHWIGYCDGASFSFELSDSSGKLSDTLDVWIKYPELMYAAEFVAVSSNSTIGRRVTEQKIKLEAKNPFSLDKLPVFVTDELDYPEGCDNKLGIPSISEQDAKFAKKNRLKCNFFNEINASYEERFKLCTIAMKSKLGGIMKSSKLRDWLISRQRNWGTPIPIVYCNECGPVPVPFSELPVYPTPRDQPPPIVSCPNCEGDARRETDTMDTFVDSAWYFLRFADSKNDLEPFSKEKVDYLFPIDVYVGGKEHAVLHLYYARFFCHFLHSIGLLKEPEPFKRLVVQGMITGKTYIVEDTGKYLCKEDVIEKKDGSLVEASSGKKVKISWEKMSKSRFNGVEPKEVIEMYGIDTARLLILASVAPTSQRRWTSETFAGVLNWQKRIWVLMDSFLESRREGLPHNSSNEEDLLIFDARNFFIKGVTFNYSESHQLSVAISKMQGFTNHLKKCSKSALCNSLEFERALAALIIMLSPMAPHFCSELWSALQNVPGRLDSNARYIKWDDPVILQTWPTLDLNYELELVCKVNNVVKDGIKMPFGQLNNLDKKSALKLALEQEKVHSFINGRDILNCEYEIIEGFESRINILIDYLQKNESISNMDKENV